MEINMTVGDFFSFSCWTGRERKSQGINVYFNSRKAQSSPEKLFKSFESLKLNWDDFPCEDTMQQYSIFHFTELSGLFNVTQILPHFIIRQPGRSSTFFWFHFKIKRNIISLLPLMLIVLMSLKGLSMVINFSTHKAKLLLQYLIILEQKCASQRTFIKKRLLQTSAWFTVWRRLRTDFHDVVVCNNEVMLSIVTGRILENVPSRGETESSSHSQFFQLFFTFFWAIDDIAFLALFWPPPTNRRWRMTPDTYLLSFLQFLSSRHLIIKSFSTEMDYLQTIVIK